MRVFILGGSGLIGMAVVQNLIAAGHDVFALARSDQSLAKLAAIGAHPIRGDIRDPAPWCDTLPTVDGVIHLACDFANDMAAIDARFLGELIPALHRISDQTGHTPRFIYTGGSWLFPANRLDHGFGNETTPLDPLPDFAWMVFGLSKILFDAKLHGMVIHPGTVYRTNPGTQITEPPSDLPGGVLYEMVRSARDENRIEIVGDGTVLWPMVHTDDLADLYRRVFEHGKRGQSYIGVGVKGIRTAVLARLIAARFGNSDCDISHISPDQAAQKYGQWAHGLGHSHRLSSQKAMAKLGWHPRHTDIARDLDIHLTGMQCTP